MGNQRKWMLKKNSRWKKSILNHSSDKVLKKLAQNAFKTSFDRPSYKIRKNSGKNNPFTSKMTLNFHFPGYVAKRNGSTFRIRDMFRVNSLMGLVSRMGVVSLMETVIIYVSLMESVITYVSLMETVKSYVSLMEAAIICVSLMEAAIICVSLVEAMTRFVSLMEAVMEAVMVAVWKRIAVIKFIKEIDIVIALIQTIDKPFINSCICYTCYTLTKLIYLAHKLFINEFYTSFILSSIAIVNLLCLSCPSIIMSFYQSYKHSSLWCCRSITFTKMEPIPQGVGRNVFPARDKIHPLLEDKKPSHKMNLEKIKLNIFLQFALFIINQCIPYSKVTKSFKKVFNVMSSMSFYWNEKNSKISRRWMAMLRLTRAGDVEMNPGPETITLVTLNCRGLKKDIKIRQLINRIYKSHGANNIIVALQETHLETTSLQYQWNGPHIFTPGTSNQGGCITLLGSNMSFSRQVNIGNEAHIAIVDVIHSNETKQYIITNIHAPCAHNRKKLDFFKTIRDEINNIVNGDDIEIILMGDFNTVMAKEERINTKFTRTERNILCDIIKVFNDLDMKDCWDDKPNNMTWKHGDKMSKIDRIWYTQGIKMDKVELSTDGTYITLTLIMQQLS